MSTAVSTLPLAAAFMASVTWAIGSSTYSFLSRTYPAQSINFSRAFLVFPLFLIVSIVTSYFHTGTFFSGLAGMSSDNFVWLVVSNIASFALGDVFFLASTNYVGVPTALAIASTYPILAALSAWLFDGQQLAIANYVGLFVAVVGTVIVIKTGKQSLTQNLSPEKYRTGIILALITSCFWALNTYSSSKGGQGLNPFDANVVRMLCAIVLCPSIGFLKDKSWSFFLPKPIMKKYTWVFLLEAFLGSTFYMYGMANTPMAIGAVLTSLAPVLTVPVALWLGWEKFSLSKSLGIVFVILGIAFLMTSFN